MSKGMKITEENIEDLIAFGRMFGLNLEDIKDEWEFNKSESFCMDTYVVLSGVEENKSILFVAMTDIEFWNNWKFAKVAMQNSFVEIERNNKRSPH